jgi:outer membrane protein assembly factor BamB
VRFAPAYTAAECNGSDDGYLYCLDAAKGTVIWKKRLARKTPSS